MNGNGTVEVNGVDTAQPTTPFEFAWGDGETTSGFFPQQHVYANAAENYVVAITATENNGTTQKYSVPVFFISPNVTKKLSQESPFKFHPAQCNFSRTGPGAGRAADGCNRVPE